MTITKDNLHQAIAALRQCAKENENKQTDTGAVRVSDLCNDVANYLDSLPKWECFGTSPCWSGEIGAKPIQRKFTYEHYAINADKLFKILPAKMEE